MVILDFDKGICYTLGRQKITVVHGDKRKAPEVATPGLFYSVVGGWINPKAGYQLFVSVQPFADVVGGYIYQNGENKR